MISFACRQGLDQLDKYWTCLHFFQAMRKLIMKKATLRVAIAVVAFFVLLTINSADADVHKKILKIGFKALKKAPVFPLVFPLPLPSVCTRSLSQHNIILMFINISISLYTHLFCLFILLEMHATSIKHA